jgi:site-specific DNA-methyltransferase (adenine-specific)
LIKPRGAIVLFGRQPFTTQLIASNLQWFKYALVWDKQRAGNFLTAKLMPMITHEDVIVFSPATVANCAHANMTYNPQMSKREKPIRYRKGKDSELYARKNTVSVWYTSDVAYPKSIMAYSKQSGLHPTQKPVALLEYLIRTYTNEGETVLDNTMGSGSTLVACLGTGRNGIGIELQQNYFEIAKARLKYWEAHDN